MTLTDRPTTDAGDDLMRYPLEIEVEPDGPAATLRLVGHLDLNTTGTLWSCLEALDPAYKVVTLDLSRMSFLDSSGLGQLVHARRAFAVEMRELRLRNPSDHARFVFELTGLSDLIEAETETSEV